ncbi:MAG: GNAT family N-acetyltransferase [Butyrivibrio sp.]|nr:GNAT family N-acetyltransferase [Butyrivibrio sp.]
MSEYVISQISKESIDAFEGILSPELVYELKHDMPVTALAVAYEGSVVGALSGIIDTDAFIIVSIFVIPEMRRMGAGTALLKRLFELCDSEDLVLRAEYTPIGSEGRTLRPFFTAMGFRQTKAAFTTYCIDSLKSVNVDSRSLPGSRSEIMTFEDAGEEKVSRIIRQLKEGESFDLYGYLSVIDKSRSLIAVEKGEFRGCVLVENISEDMIELSLIWAAQADERSAKQMLAYVLDDIRDNNSKDIRIVIPVLDERTGEILDEFLEEEENATIGFLKDRFVEI